jgi:hypothetical protein
MTPAQIKKLDAIIFRLEALQHEIKDPRTIDKINQGKRHLIDALK